MAILSDLVGSSSIALFEHQCEVVVAFQSSRIVSEMLSKVIERSLCFALFTWAKVHHADISIVYQQDDKGKKW